MGNEVPVEKLSDFSWDKVAEHPVSHRSLLINTKIQADSGRWFGAILSTKIDLSSKSTAAVFSS